MPFSLFIWLIISLIFLHLFHFRWHFHYLFHFLYGTLFFRRCHYAIFSPFISISFISRLIIFFLRQPWCCLMIFYFFHYFAFSRCWLRFRWLRFLIFSISMFSSLYFAFSFSLSSPAFSFIFMRFLRWCWCFIIFYLLTFSLILYLFIIIYLLFIFISLFHWLLFLPFVSFLYIFWLFSAAAIISLRFSIFLRLFSIAAVDFIFSMLGLFIWFRWYINVILSPMILTPRFRFIHIRRYKCFDYFFDLPAFSLLYCCCLRFSPLTFRAHCHLLIAIAFRVTSLTCHTIPPPSRHFALAFISITAARLLPCCHVVTFI